MGYRWETQVRNQGSTCEGGWRENRLQVKKLPYTHSDHDCTPLGCLLATDRTPTCEDNCKTIEGWGMRDRGTQDCFPRPYPSQSTSNYCPQSAWPCRSGDCQPPAKLVVGGQTEVTENSCGRAWPEVNSCFNLVKAELASEGHTKGILLEVK